MEYWRAQTGFSGTNDSQKSLPLSVGQLNLLKHNHTNALALECLLHHLENSVALIPDQNQSSVSDAEALLEMVMGLDKPVQVILDVGALILEPNNLEVATHWLNGVPENGPIQAVVFVDDRDDICVLDRSGRVEALQISLFARQMEACYVFLDEADTRGINLRLPPQYRAAVT
jgi:hypothetical protein